MLFRSRHFPDKASLLAAVSAEGFVRLRADLQHAWQQAEGTKRGFDLMGVAYIGFAVNHPSYYRVMFGDFRHLIACSPDLAPTAGGAFSVLKDALVALQRAGLARQDDPQVMAEFVWAVVHGIALLSIDGQLGAQAETRERLTPLLHYALGRLRADRKSTRLNSSH